MTKLALLTGGAGSIGGATAALLRERGWGVIVPSRRQCNWTEILDVADLSDTLKLELDAVIFCHGDWYWSRDQSVADWDEQYRSRVSLPADFLRQMSAAIRGGVVIMVASTRGFIGGVENAPYASACAAQIALMIGCAREMNHTRFNVICPGLTRSKLGDQVIATGGAKPDAVPQDPAAVAAAIVSLVEGDETGQVLRVVDGQTTRARWVWE